MNSKIVRFYAHSGEYEKKEIEDIPGWQNLFYFKRRSPLGIAWYQPVKDVKIRVTTKLIEDEES